MRLVYDYTDYNIFDYCLFVTCNFIYYRITIKSIYNSSTKAGKGKLEAEQHEREEAKRQLEEIHEQLYLMIETDFVKNGWFKWDGGVNRELGQLDRLRRATDSTNPLHLLRYDNRLRIAKIRGASGNYYLTNGERCSCPDYRKRLKPCKHIYFLATILEEYKEELKPDTSVSSSNSCDNILGGLRFAIAGRNQTAVKNFIVNHSGTYGDFSRSESTALIITDDKMTAKRADAVMYNIQLLTFDELQCLFNTNQ